MFKSIFHRSSSTELDQVLTDPEKADALLETALVDDQVYAGLLADETDLLDDYVRGAGSPEQREQVAALIGRSSAVQERAEFAAFFADAVHGARDFPQSKPVPLGFLAALIALPTSAATLWLIFGDGGSQTMPLFLIGLLVWVALVGIGISYLHRWRRSRDRLRAWMLAADRESSSRTPREAGRVRE